MARSKSSGSHYALTAIGVGLLVLGVVMAVWNLVPGFGSNDKPTSSHGNSSLPENNVNTNTKSKTFSVAYVLIGSGIGLLLIAICLSIRNKKLRQSAEASRITQEVVHGPHANAESHEVDAHRYSAPSYEEVMREFEHPGEIARNERISITLPSYESLHDIDELTPTRPNTEPAKDDLPQRTNSRSGKEKKPLHVRRIKSDKLHLKEFRLNLSGRSNVPKVQAIEPLTPPPQYDDDKPPGFN
uniref:EF-hand domain family member D2 n=1 Tax=Leptobrachium leishanense TaxID=445787 RepID=A0A8C5PFH7_9ANUR